MTAVEENKSETPAIVDPDEQAPVGAETPAAPSNEEAEEAQGFLDGYSDTHPEAEPTETATPKDEEPPPDGSESSTKSTELTGRTVEIDAERLALLERASEDVQALRTQLEQVSGKVFGKMGDIERRIHEKQSATPLGQTLTIDDKDFEELKAEFPEFAEMTQKGLSRVFEKFKGTGVDVTKLLDDVRREGDEKLERLMLADLTDRRPDWSEVVGPTEEDWKRQHPDQPYVPSAYRQWLATQSPDYQHTINGSLLPGQIIRSIEQFEAATKKPPTPPATDRRRRMTAAVTPRSTGGAPLTSEPSPQDAFRAGFKEVQAQ